MLGRRTPSTSTGWSTFFPGHILSPGGFFFFDLKKRPLSFPLSLRHSIICFSSEKKPFFFVQAIFFFPQFLPATAVLLFALEYTTGLAILRQDPSSFS